MAPAEAEVMSRRRLLGNVLPAPPGRGRPRLHHAGRPDPTPPGRAGRRGAVWPRRLCPSAGRALLLAR